MAITHCLTSDSAWPNGAIRRRWSPAELLALERWAGVLPVQVICRRLDRSERSVRCQMHRRGLSTRVREGVGLRQVCEDLQLSARSAKAFILDGRLRLHSAQVHGGVMAQLHWSLRRWLQTAQSRLCRVSHLRVTETSLRRFAREADFGASGSRTGAAWQHWASG
ncbi:hypothetical protein [Delftia sp. WSY_22]|uniref:hypothetical protein n=1 Tax=Delftia sp. WSY_22 TaxID=3367213 RepID=UPI00370CDADE